MYSSYSQQIWDGNTVASSEVMFITLFTLFLFIVCKAVQLSYTQYLFKGRKLNRFILLVL